MINVSRGKCGGTILTHAEFAAMKFFRRYRGVHGAYTRRLHTQQEPTCVNIIHCYCDSPNVAYTVNNDNSSIYIYIYIYIFTSKRFCARKAELIVRLPRHTGLHTVIKDRLRAESSTGLFH
jgi:hypothetical protein